jgi:hypothetical protein
VVASFQPTGSYYVLREIGINNRHDSHMTNRFTNRAHLDAQIALDSLWNDLARTWLAQALRGD